MAKVLVAEADHLIRWSLEQGLGRDGHQVESVDPGMAAVHAAKGGGYQVAIIDYGTPDPTGSQVLRWIKTQVPQTHVIVITAEPTPHMERKARDLGAFDFLEKPFHFRSLREAVDRAIMTPERRKGPRGCCNGCEWQNPCGGWSARVRV